MLLSIESRRSSKKSAHCSLAMVIVLGGRCRKALKNLQSHGFSRLYIYICKLDFCHTYVSTEEARGSSKGGAFDECGSDDADDEGGEVAGPLSCRFRIHSITSDLDKGFWINMAFMILSSRSLTGTCVARMLQTGWSEVMEVGSKSKASNGDLFQ